MQDISAARHRVVTFENILAGLLPVLATVETDERGGAGVAQRGNDMLGVEGINSDHPAFHVAGGAIRQPVPVLPAIRAGKEAAARAGIDESGVIPRDDDLAHQRAGVAGAGNDPVLAAIFAEEIATAIVIHKDAV